MTDIKYYNNNEFNQYSPSSVFGHVNHLKHFSNDFGAIETETVKIAFFVKSIIGIKRLTICDFEGSKELNEQTFSQEMDRLFKFMKEKLKIAIVTAPPSYVLFPFKIENAKNLQFGTVVINLNKEDDQLLSELHGKHRNVVKKAIKDGVIIEEGNHLKTDCIKTVRDTLIREKTYIESEQEFLQIDKALNKNLKYFLATKDGVIQGAAIIPYDEKNAFYLWGGSKIGPSTGAMNLLHWEIIRYFKSLNLSNYDLVGIRPTVEKGSKYEGLKRFKTRFGGTVKVGYLAKADLNPFKAFLFKSILTLKNRSIPKDIIDKV